MPGRNYSQELQEPSNPVVLPWPQFAAMFSKAHRQGEHVAIVAPTGSGKTQLGLELCQAIGDRTAEDGRPSRVTIVNLKPRDDTLSEFQEKGKSTGQWHTIKKWPPSYGEEHCVVWPKGGPPSGAAKRQRAVVLPLVDTIYTEGKQTLYLPEAAYIERTQPHGLGMSGSMEQLWSTARGLKLTVISDTQRPRQVTRLMWSEPSWLIIFNVDDEDDLKRVAEMSGRKVDVWRIAPKLGGFEFLCIRRQKTGVKSAREIYVSRVDVTRNNRNNKEDKEQ